MHSHRHKSNECTRTHQQTRTRGHERKAPPFKGFITKTNASAHTRITHRRPQTPTFTAPHTTHNTCHTQDTHTLHTNTTQYKAQLSENQMDILP